MAKARKRTTRKLTSEELQRLPAAQEAAQRAGRARYDGPMNAVLADIKTLLAGRSPRSLTGAEAVQFMSLRAEFDGIAIQQKHFVEADLAFRLNPGEGSETVDA